MTDQDNIDLAVEAAQHGFDEIQFDYVRAFAVPSLWLHRLARRTGLQSARFRPWLQAFRDYSFDRRPFTRREIRAQIRGAEDFGSNGWMLCNPRNSYSAEGLSPEDAGK